MKTTEDKRIVYIGDFDITNENVQSFLVLNNGRVLNGLGYKVDYIGINRKLSCSDDGAFSEKMLDGVNTYLELPYTLTFSGIRRIGMIKKAIINRLNKLNANEEVQYVITYQSPSYASVLKTIAIWCKKNNVPYIVNCADIPIFSQQPLHRRIVMKNNWNYMHRINKKYEDGIIAVSFFIREFYHKDNIKGVIIPPMFDTSKAPSFSDKRDVPTFVYAGCPFKNTGAEVKTSNMKDRLDYVIDIFLELEKKNKPFIFKIIGIEKEDYIAGVPRHKDVPDRYDNIEFLGVRDHKTTLEEVAQADFSISYREENTMNMAGFPTKVVESVSVGTPIIINDISDVFDYVGDDCSGFELKKDDFAYNVEMVGRLCEMTPKERYDMKTRVFDAKIFDCHGLVDRMKCFLADI